MKADTLTNVEQVDVIIAETNTVSIHDREKEAFVEILKPIADRLPEYAEKVEALTVTNQDQADAATRLWEQIVEDLGEAETTINLFSNKLIERLHKLHRGWTGLRARFTDPLSLMAKTVKKRVGDWQEAERIKAEDEQRRLQAEADAKARKEQERLEKLAASKKTPEKQQQYMEAARQVVAPTITVAAPKSGIRFQKRWKVKQVNTAQFIAAAAASPFLHSYIEIRIPLIERSKAANPGLELAGVTFEQVNV